MSSILLILSVLVGAFIVLFIKPTKQFISLLLAFSGSYLLSVTVLHLLPEVYVETNSPQNNWGLNIIWDFITINT